jgi:signal transduction histidine kinase
MTVDETLSAITRAAFVVIALILAAGYVRVRTSMRRDALVMFAVLALAIVMGEIGQIAQFQPRWLTAGSAILIVAQPLLLLRLVEHFRHVWRPAVLAAAAGFLVSAGILAVMPPPLPARATIAIVLYFGATNAYAASVLLRAGRESTGVLRRRMVLVGQGTGMLAAVILLAGIAAALPAAQPVVQPLSRVLALLSTIWYYLGFTPPARLRQTWQLRELHAFLTHIATRPVDERVATILDDLCRTATRAVGGLASIAMIRDEEDGDLVVRAADTPGLELGAPHAGSLTERVWRERRAAVASREETSGRIHDLASALESDLILAAPIGSRARAWGVLVVIQSRASLFPSDDLDLLQLLGEQAALVLDVGHLLSEHTTLIGQLHESAGRLEDANQELEAFSYSVAHDLRAPLRAMDGFSKLVAEEHATLLPQDAQRHLRLVRESAQHMGDLIDDLLTFSRLARQPLRKQRIDTTRIVQQVVADLRREEPDSRAQIRIDDLPECEADPALLRQVFTNLVANALKFSRARTEPVVEVLSQLDGDESVYIVRDNGVGFDMRYADKLFRVFQRLHRAEEYEGTGVGLAIVQRVVHRHGGRVWADAQVERGATFYFTLGGMTDGERSGRDSAG